LRRRICTFVFFAAVVVDLWNADRSEKHRVDIRRVVALLVILLVANLLAILLVAVPVDLMNAVS
jgi:heme A synthase